MEAKIMAENKEMLMHTIRIDNFMTLEWQIPKEITPLELKAMSYKINKLFNISEVDIVEEPKTSEEVNEVISKKKLGGKSGKWTEELTAKVIELYNDGLTATPIAEILTKMTGDTYFDRIHIETKIKTLRNNKLVTSNLGKRPQHTEQARGIRFEAEDINRLKDIWQSGIRVCSNVRNEMQTKYNRSFNTTAIANKLWQMKKNGMIKDGQ